MRFHPLIAGVLLLGTAGCEHPTAPEGGFPDVRQWVTGEAASNLDARGNFRLSRPRAPGPAPITTPSRAGQLALAWVQAVTGPSFLVPSDLESFVSAWERHHGGAIDFARLQIGSRAYYAASPYEPLPDSVPVFIRKYLGPSYLVHLLSGESVALSVLGSAYNTDLWVEDGRLYFPHGSGNEFRGVGVPRGAGHVLPVSPEHAVAVAAQATGARITDVPELLLPHRHFFGNYARWRLVLDRTVLLRGQNTGAIYETREVYVGYGHRQVAGRAEAEYASLFVPQPLQPAADTIRYLPPADELGERGGRRELQVRLRPGMPVFFEQVEPAE